MEDTNIIVELLHPLSEIEERELDRELDKDDID